MIVMSLRLCQLKSLLLVLLMLASCTHKRKAAEVPNELITMFHANWFKADSEHTLTGTDGGPAPHLFFDVNPEFSGDSREVNVVVMTPEGSPYDYRLDPLSGQRYYSTSYCKEPRPSYSIAYVPRFLDQLGSPQKVLVFGGADRVRELHRYSSFRVRLVGAFIERTCPEGNCEDKSKWLARLVFIGVDPADGRYADVTEVEQFKKKVDWEKLKRHLEVIDGKNRAGIVTFDYVKVRDPVPFKDAFEFFRKHSIFMSEKESTKIKAGCHALYDRLWTEVGVERPEDRPTKTVEEIATKAKLREEIKREGKPVGFAQRFQAFTRNYYDEMSTCGRFVYGGNLNRDPEKFWFLSFVNFFFSLNKGGYFFDCRHQSWQRNLFDTRGRPVYDLKEEVGECDETDLDLAMAYIPNFLERIKGEADEYYRFVDYDNHVFGTHSKLYSWVKIPSKKMSCADDPNEKIRTELSVFPDDVKWKPRKVKDLESKLKIIY